MDECSDLFVPDAEFTGLRPQVSMMSSKWYVKGNILTGLPK
jgi:hypothetical protein